MAKMVKDQMLEDEMIKVKVGEDEVDINRSIKKKKQEEAIHTAVFNDIQTVMQATKIKQNTTL